MEGKVGDLSTRLINGDGMILPTLYLTSISIALGLILAKYKLKRDKLSLGLIEKEKYKSYLKGALLGLGLLVFILILVFL